MLTAMHAFLVTELEIVCLTAEDRIVSGSVSSYSQNPGLWFSESLLFRSWWLNSFPLSKVKLCG